MSTEFQNILVGLASLAALFGSQVYLVKRFVEFIKGVSGLKGSAVRLLSFGVGMALGGLFYWSWLELFPGLDLSAYVLTGVLFLLMAGLTASGDYDLNHDETEVQ